jgi:hypothetical protein
MLALSDSGRDSATAHTPAIPWRVRPKPTSKIAHTTNRTQNRPHDNGKNRLQGDAENRPDIINPVPLFGIVMVSELKRLLMSKGQVAWCTSVRLLGVLLLIDYILRNLKKGQISISADLAHQFVSKLRNSGCGRMITEPLSLLCKIGVLQRIRPAVHAHVKASAVYSFAPPYRKNQIRLELVLPPKLTTKLRSADHRREARLNRKFPWREKLLADLLSISFSASARPIIAAGLLGKSGENLKRLVSAVDVQAHFVKVSERGQITTSVGSCPKDLQPHLLLNGERTVLCDIANAHWNFLPLILTERLDHVSGSPGRQNYINEGWREHNRLVALLNDGDFYRAFCIDPQDDDERGEKKRILNVLLNSKNEDCDRNVLYRRLGAEFPITFRTIEDLRAKDHRNLSKQLQRFIADTIAAALLKVQQAGVAAIPLVDALICQQSDSDWICETIGKQVFQTTGVCCRVGGIRYSPLTEDETRALAFDEIAQSDDGMSYDDWEANRIAKCEAALKLLRRRPRLETFSSNRRQSEMSNTFFFTSRKLPNTQPQPGKANRGTKTGDFDLTDDDEKIG